MQESITFVRRMHATFKNRLKIKFYTIFKHAILVFSLVFLNYLTSAQTSPSFKANKSILDSNASITSDSNSRISPPISTDKLEHPVHYTSKDSIVYDAKMKKLYLHQTADISYDDIKINADFVVYEQDSNRLTALLIDSLVNPTDTANHRPKIFQGQESSTFSLLQYNFKSRRALIENAYSQYGEGFILSNQVKRNNDNSISGFKNIYTTCNDPHPHFGIAARKIKIIPNKVAVAGSANLVIEDIPTPLYLPFGLFPLKQGQRSGFKLPTYSMTDKLGFGLIEGGYYFAINDRIDLLALADIYALGTWRAGFVSKYKYNYRFNGMFSFNYAYNKIGENFEPGNQNSRNYNINWSHNIDPNVLPGSSFSAYVNIGSNKYQKNNSFDPNLILTNTYQSNISYAKNFKGKYMFSAALRHTQQTQNGYVQLTLPDISFSANQFFPLLWRKDVIKPRWYEKIGCSYQFLASNQLNFYDSAFSIANLRFRDFTNGFKHSIPINASYQMLKYINLSFNAGYNEYWYTKKFFKSYNFSDNKLDTIQQNGFFTARDFNAGFNLSTRIFGTKLFRKGAIKGIRHVLAPNVGFTYRPDFGAPVFNYYYNTFIDKNYNSRQLSYFDGAIYGYPPTGKLGAITMSLGNNLSMKVRSKKDTINGGIKKINLIDGLDFATRYNLAVDSFRWSNLDIRYRTTLYENISFSGGFSYTPYAINKTTGNRSPAYLYETDGRLLRFQTANISFTGSFPIKKQNGSQQVATDEQKRAIGNFDNYADFAIPWHLNITYSMNVDKIFLKASQRDTLQWNQNVIFFGDINFTPKWKVAFRSGYDFTNKEIGLTTLDIYRDLHCWEMKLNIIPFGYRRSYNFGLNVKASVLQDLKLTRRKDFRDFL